METNVRRIGILTSGGDAPGMNAAIRAAVRNCIHHGITPIGIRRGYNGLIQGDTFEMDARSVNNLSNRGGTILYTARCKEFTTPEGVQQAVRTCKYAGIDGIIAIGGDGTFRGAGKLSEAGISTVGVPATIDNDIGCSHYTIGFDTAANTAIECIDKLSDTMQSHERASVVEVMGRHAGHLAVYVGLAVGATAILVPEFPVNLERDVIEKVREGRYRGKHHFLIIVAEGVGKCDEIAQQIEAATGIDARVSILGHIQRGGSPTARDRTMAARMGHTAVEELAKGNTDLVVCYRDSHIVTIPIDEALQMTKPLDPYMYKVAYDVSI